MRLIIGGACQGKTGYVEENFPTCRIYDETSVGELDKTTAEELLVVNHFHRCVKALLEEGRTEDEICCRVKALVEKYPDIIIISDEIGSGIVPMEKQERLWREVTGRVLCELAKEAERVVRLTCGIPMILK